jgi:hypothetical protein
MRGSVVAGAILGFAALVGVPAQAGAAAPDPYSPSVDTDCVLIVENVVEPGEKVVFRVSVEANSPTPPAGKVDLTIQTSDGGSIAARSAARATEVLWSKTITYDGGVRTVVGPRVTKGHHYTATQHYRPFDSTFEECRAHQAFNVGASDGGGPDDENPGGTLPDTGGPAMLWLLLGLSLTGGGVATVVYARRRTSPAFA